MQAMRKPAVRRGLLRLPAGAGTAAALIAAVLAVPQPAAALPVPLADSISRTVTTLRPNHGDSGRALVLQADGRVLVAGVAGGDFGLARYTTGGTRDNFATDGLATTDFGGADGANAAMVDGDRPRLALRPMVPSTP